MKQTQPPLTKRRDSTMFDACQRVARASGLPGLLEAIERGRFSEERTPEAWEAYHRLVVEVRRGSGSKLSPG